MGVQVVVLAAAQGRGGRLLKGLVRSKLVNRITSSGQAAYLRSEAPRSGLPHAESRPPNASARVDGFSVGRVAVVSVLERLRRANFAPGKLNAVRHHDPHRPVEECDWLTLASSTG